MNFNAADELDKLLKGLRQEIIWVLALVILGDGVSHPRRSDIDGGLGGSYLFIDKSNMEPFYAGSSSDIKNRVKNHGKHFKGGRKTWIIAFYYQYCPLDLRMAVEAFIKVLFSPTQSLDNRKARMSSAKINALRYLVQQWIRANGTDEIKEQLDRAFPLQKARIVESDKYSSWEEHCSENKKKWEFSPELPKTPATKIPYRLGRRIVRRVTKKPRHFGKNLMWMR